MSEGSFQAAGEVGWELHLLHVCEGQGGDPFPEEMLPPLAKGFIATASYTDAGVSCPSPGRDEMVIGLLPARSALTILTPLCLLKCDREYLRR